MSSLNKWISKRMQQRRLRLVRDQKCDHDWELTWDIGKKFYVCRKCKEPGFEVPVHR